MQNRLGNISFLFFMLCFVGSLSAIDEFNHKAQKNFIHKDLGKIYLGMPLKELADETNLSKASVTNRRFDAVELTVPINGKNVESVRVKISGLTRDDLAGMVVSESTEGEDGDIDIDRIVVSKIPKNGFVYALYIKFLPDFNLKSYSIKTFGNDGLVREADDPYHFYDIQWTKKTSDGLGWLIRSLHEGDSRTLQLLGRIEGTEWAMEEA